MLIRQDLEKRLRGAWSKESSANERWTPENPALGQCAVSALIVQDVFGGRLMRTIGTDGKSHYYNELPDGVRYDTTASQFDGMVNYEGAAERTREYVLSFPETAKRYEILKTKFDELVSKP